MVNGVGSMHGGWVRLARTLLMGGLLSLPEVVLAGGWSNPAVPTKIEIVPGNPGGFVVFGAVGNPGTCTVADRIFVETTHPQYHALYSTALAAATAGKKLQVYAHDCKPIGWYAVLTTTFNTLTSGGSMAIITP